MKKRNSFDFKYIHLESIHESIDKENNKLIKIINPSLIKK